MLENHVEALFNIQNWGKGFSSRFSPRHICKPLSQHHWDKDHLYQLLVPGMTIRFITSSKIHYLWPSSIFFECCLLLGFQYHKCYTIKAVPLHRGCCLAAGIADVYLCTLSSKCQPLVGWLTGWGRASSCHILNSCPMLDTCSAEPSELCHQQSWLGSEGSSWDPCSGHHQGLYCPFPLLSLSLLPRTVHRMKQRVRWCSYIPYDIAG